MKLIHLTLTLCLSLSTGPACGQDLPAAIRFLEGAQARDGAWTSAAGAGPFAITAAVIRALAEAEKAASRVREQGLANLKAGQGLATSRVALRALAFRACDRVDAEDQAAIIAKQKSTALAGGLLILKEGSAS